MTAPRRGPTNAGGAAEAWDLLTWYGTPTEEESENEQRYGVAQPPTVLAFGITVTGDELRAEIVNTIRPIRVADRAVTLHHQDGRTRTVRLHWNDCLRPARWGDATFRII